MAAGKEKVLLYTSKKMAESFSAVGTRIDLSFNRLIPAVDVQYR